ncbi:hypothetical protein AB4139_11945 [Vibrio cyclitrophicus]
MNDDKLLKVEHKSHEEDMDLGCDCDGETTIKVESEISTYEPVDAEGMDALDYKIDCVTETCKACGFTRDYELEPRLA